MDRSQGEIFHPIEDFPTHEINARGDVRNKRTKHILSQYLDAYGYPAVSLWVGDKTVMRKVHRLLGKTFILNPSDKREINHINGNTQNNNLANLEWVTREENMEHANRTRLINNKGERHGMSKLKVCDVQLIRWILKNSDMLEREIGEIFNVTRANISCIKRRASWSHV